MLIEFHFIQNYAPSNLNRDDLGAPKTCYFGGVLRSRISSQSIKRSIRMSEDFKNLCGGIRTRRLAELILSEFEDNKKDYKKVDDILEKCGIKPKPGKNDSKKKKDKASEDVIYEDNIEQSNDSAKDTKMLVYTTFEAISEIANTIKSNLNLSTEELARKVAEIIATKTAVPDMALTGRMLEPSGAGDTWKNLNNTVEAALQVAHAISTHEAHPEIDYFVAADDIPGSDSGAGFLDESMFSSSCYYKYFSINWEQLVNNLKGNKELAAHTIGAFLNGAVMQNPSGKQNSYAAHNQPDGVLVEIKKSPISYANAFAKPVSYRKGKSIIELSIDELGQYANDIKVGYGLPMASFWFSNNNKYPISDKDKNTDVKAIKSLDELTVSLIDALANLLDEKFSWEQVQKEVLEEKNRLNKKV